MDEPKKVTVKWIMGEVAEINAVRHDDEKAHSMEDGLHEMVLRAIAEGARNPRQLAEAALKTCDLQFARRCA